MSKFLDLFQGKTFSNPPLWFMRQAGRYMSEYRALRQRHSLLDLCRTPDLATEVTLQPIDLVGVDAAIIFSDILVVPEAMGLDYEMVEAKGPKFPKVIENRSDVAALSAGREPPDRSVVITFDDGRVNQYHNAVPVLKKLGFTATFFPFTHAMDKNPRYFTWAQLRELQQGGFTIGSSRSSVPPCSA